MRKSQIWAPVVLLVAVAITAVTIWSIHSQASREREVERQPLRPIPAEQDRGEVPLAGYSIQGRGTLGEAQTVSVHLWSPYYDVKVDDYYPCQVRFHMARGEDGRIHFTSRLVWSPLKMGDMKRDDECHIEKLKHEAPKDLTSGTYYTNSYSVLDDDLENLTVDGPVIHCVKANKTASCSGSAPTAAKPGNPLPELDDMGAPK